jgi:hypothetical protein
MSDILSDLDSVWSPAPQTGENLQADLDAVWSPAVEDKDDKSWIGQIGKGVITAPITFAEGIAELGATGIDAALDTNISSSVSGAFDSINEFVGTPEEGAGRVANEVVTFGLGFIPILGWLGHANKAAKVTQAGGQAMNLASKSRYYRSAAEFGSSKMGRALLGNNAKLMGATALTAGLYEGTVTPDDRNTLADSIDWLPDSLETQELDVLSGRERAKEAFKNRFKLAVEAGAMSLGFDAALTGIGAAGRVAAQPAGEVLSRLKTSQASQAVFDAIDKTMQGSTAQQLKRKAQFMFAPNRGADPIIMSEMRDAQNFITGKNSKAYNIINNLNKETQSFIKQAGVRGTNGARNPEQVQQDFFDYLVGRRNDLAEYPRAAVKAVDNAISLIKDLSDEQMVEIENVIRALPEGSPRRKAAEELKEVMIKNDKNGVRYIRRVFDAHARPGEFYKNLDLSTPLVKEAIDEVTNNIFYSRDFTGNLDMAKAQAKETVLDSLGMQSVKLGVPPDEAIKGTLNSVKKASGLFKGEVLRPGKIPSLRIDAGAFVPRKEIIDDSPAMRKLLGEVTDPNESIKSTVETLANNITSMRFYNQYSRTSSKDLKTGFDQLKSGARPLAIQVPDVKTMSDEQIETVRAMFADEARERTISTGVRVSPDDLIEEYKQALVNTYDYVRLGAREAEEFVSPADGSVAKSPTTSTVSGGAFGDMTGRYVPREVFDAITATSKTMTSVPILTEAVAMLNAAIGQVQRATVISNPASRMRDIVGSTLMGIGSGMFKRDMDIAGNLQVALSKTYRMADADANKMRDIADMIGIRDSNVTLNLINKFTREAEQLGTSTLSRGVIKGTAKAREMPLLKQIAQLSEGFDGLAAGTDFLMKFNAFFSEKEKLQALLKKAGIDENDIDAIELYMRDSGLVSRASSGANPNMSPLDVIAAERVKNLMPNYDMVGYGMREYYARVPFIGNFTSFASETIRNTANILELGLKELSYAASDDLIEEVGEKAAKQLQAATRAMGAHRLTSLVAVTSGVPYAISRASMAATGTTPEQVEAAKRQGQDFLLGADVMVASNDQNGTIELVNLNQTMPYAFVKEGVNAALETYAQNGELDKGTVANILGSGYQMVRKYFEPFLENAIIAERMIDVTRGATSTGAKIYDKDNASFGDIVSAGVAHIGDAFIPGYAKLVVKGEGGEFRPGNVTRAVAGIPAKSTEELSVQGELGKIVTGATPIKIDAFKQATFAADDYSTKRSSAKSWAERILNAPDRTESEMISGWSEYLDKIYARQSELYSRIQDMRAMGLTDQKIRVAMMEIAEEGTKEINSLMKGEFYPGFRTPEAQAKLRRSTMEGYDNRLVKEPPFETLFKMSQERIGEKLAPAPTEELTFEALDAIWSPSGSAPRQSTTQPLQTAPAQPVGPVTYQPPAPMAPAGPVPNELLGGNPFEQMRNAPLQSLRPVARP